MARADQISAQVDTSLQALQATLAMASQSGWVMLAMACDEALRNVDEARDQEVEFRSFRGIGDGQ